MLWWCDNKSDLIWFDCVNLDTRQDSHCDIIVCVFAREDTKVNNNLMQVYFNGMVFCFYLVCYLYAKLTLACIWDTMIRYRGVGKVRIISTPNRNIYLCHWNTLSRDNAAVLSKQCLSARACFIHMVSARVGIVWYFFRYRCRIDTFKTVPVPELCSTQHTRVTTKICWTY